MKAIIRPETEMKESGIEWIGNIPRIWKIRKINSLFETIGSGTTPNSNIEEYYQGIHHTRKMDIFYLALMIMEMLWE